MQQEAWRSPGPGLEVQQEAWRSQGPGLEVQHEAWTLRAPQQPQPGGLVGENVCTKQETFRVAVKVEPSL